MRRISKVGPTSESHFKLPMVRPEILSIDAFRKLDFQDVVSRQSCDNSSLVLDSDRDSIVHEG